MTDTSDEPGPATRLYLAGGGTLPAPGRTGAILAEADRIAFDRERYASETPAETDARYKAEVAQHERDKAVMIESFRPATSFDYSAWLVGYLDRGGEIASHSRRTFSADGWYVALRDFNLRPLYGSNLLHIIVPVGVSVTGRDTGHSSLYFMEGFTSLTFHGRRADVISYADLL